MELFELQSQATGLSLHEHYTALQQHQALCNFGLFAFYLPVSCFVHQFMGMKRFDR